MSDDDIECYLRLIGSEKLFNESNTLWVVMVLALIHRISGWSCRIWVFSLHRDISMWWFYCTSIKSNQKYFFPLRSEPSHRNWMICLAHVDDNYLMVVYLKNDCPIPSIPCYGDENVEMTQSHGKLDMSIWWLLRIN